MPTGVILLNGASSAGKTELAMAIQPLLEPEWIIVGIDDFLRKVDPRWRGSGDEGTASLVFVENEHGLVPRASGAGESLLRAYRAAVAAIAREGIGVIVDEVCFPGSWDGWSTALDGLAVLRVGVTCSPEVAEERERARGDRRRGLTLGLAAEVHNGATYDLAVDTTSRSAADLARDVVHAWRARPNLMRR